MLAEPISASADVGITHVSVTDTPTAPADATLLDAYSEAVSGVVDRAAFAVIHLEVTTADRQHGSGSGFFLSPDGYALTNSHVVHGARKITAALADGRRLPADLIGDDPDTDLAVVRVGTTDAPHLRFADSDRLRPGQIAVARSARNPAASSKTSSRLTPPSIPATPAARSSIPAAKSSASTPPSSVPRKASASPSRATSPAG